MKEYYLEPLAYYLQTTTNSEEWIVFFHAAFVNHKMFDSQVQYFKDKYNILVIDILGHGNSINDKTGATIEKMAEYTNNILVKHNIAKAHFVGVSLGAVIAQDFANFYKDKVQSMACFGGYDINDFDEQKQKANSAAQMKLVFKAMISIKAFAKANKEISAYTVEGKEKFYNINLEFKKKSLMYLADLHKLINKYPKQPKEFPLLIGCGEFDLPMEMEIIEDWAKKENCSKVIFEGAGHCVNLDKPQEFNEVLQDFWNQIGK